ncbi:FtsW/RodA/SpoVE family cell cycle protein [Aliarcobacter cryaerophilus]|uniref:FtsW/RodA/SpoVE family cell cycle protein n=1 Tax=Aliarcobacter cryaerophilus TaxID=28198 RepID=UPI0008254049|nr:FtsW/RodA/SpoVE family cell cycle protein [Aliarcobacter cryaerophilus]NCB10238.1 rod shape-determining protein RodA [Erysipelotrichia bacterium]MCT7406253.1 rod shape-determining protein RodA [Aliarcobacter cryaerophilus]MCT7463053.1 rod shape-determining protein RodA [Aliarcobacter cryaerophilus]MCT7504006.1 rod shape-determining protein RodA [Aliarcobacter cryaerophilus]MCT7546028.1 rod shape-determining protein RodA [Aliarcobacter cryaerophilus]
MRLLDKRIMSHFDYLILIFIAPLIILSYVLISEANDALASKQVFYYTISLFIFILVFMFPLRKNLRLVPFLYWIGILLLLAVEFIGVTKLGAKRWIHIPLLDTTIQPSEIIKPIYILMLGYLIQRKPPPIGGYGLKDFGYFSIYIFIPFFLIAKEPDLGTALVLLLVGYGILFIIGVNWKIWLGIVLFLSIFIPFSYNYIMKDYQKKRVHDFIVAEKPSYHVQQSIIAIGSGGLTGKDSDEATQTQLKFLPIATSDFIFAYLVERHGFLGAFGLIVLYVIIILHLFTINYFFKTDFIVKAFSSGLALLIFLNMSVNILMVIGFAPVVGIPLPLFSYGGSSFINFIVTFAILENLLAFRYMDMYNYERKM